MTAAASDGIPQLNKLKYEIVLLNIVVVDLVAEMRNRAAVYLVILVRRIQP